MRQIKKIYIKMNHLRTLNNFSIDNIMRTGGTMYTPLEIEINFK